MIYSSKTEKLTNSENKSKKALLNGGEVEISYSEQSLKDIFDKK